MKRRYFKAEHGPLHAAMTDAVEEKRKALAACREICDELGAKSGAYTSRGLYGFTWAQGQAQPKYFKASTGRHTHDEEGRKILVPDRRYKVGKALRERMDSIEFPDVQRLGSEVLDCRSQWIPGNDHRSPSGMSVFSFAFGFVNDVALAQVPIAEEGDGANMDEHGYWEPPDIDGLVEISHGEFIDLAERKG